MPVDNIYNRIKPEDNIGSLFSILFLPIEEVSGLPVHGVTLRSEVIDFATLVTLDNWLAVELAKDRGNFDSPGSDTPMGTIYKDKIVFTVAKNYAFRRIVFDDMEQRDFAVIAIDLNKKCHLFGYKTIENDLIGMKFSTDKTSGKSTGDLNKITCTFSWENQAQPWPVSDVVAPNIVSAPADPPGTA